MSSDSPSDGKMTWGEGEEPHSYVHDLHVDGMDHDHEFSPWDHDTGVEEYDNALVAFIRFESRCILCPARVGRVITSRIEHERGS